MEEELQSPEEILRNNIDKANELLDIVSENIKNSRRVGPNMLNSVARLIDSISSGAEKLIIAQNDSDSLLIKEELLKLKQRELEFKMSGLEGPKNLTQNVIVTDFNQIMKIAKSSDSTKLLRGGSDE